MQLSCVCGVQVVWFGQFRQCVSWKSLSGEGTFVFAVAVEIWAVAFAMVQVSLKFFQKKPKSRVVLTVCHCVPRRLLRLFAAMPFTSLVVFALEV